MYSLCFFAELIIDDIHVNLPFREQSFDCSCTNCTSDYTEENTVEIVHVNFGYVSSVIKLVTMDRVSSILACEPNYLIAVEQSGKMHFWVMNLEWR